MTLIERRVATTVKLSITFALIGIALGLVSCVSPTMEVQETEKHSSKTEPERIGYNNCPADVPFAATREVTHVLTHIVTWEFQDKKGIGGEVSVPKIGKVNIDETIGKRYGRTNEASTTDKQTININVPAGKQRQYVFTWTIQRRRGYIVAGNQKIGYDYPDELQFDGVTVNDLPCMAAATLISGTPRVDAAINAFVKEWKNVDPNTRGITRINISRDGGFLVGHAFGKCHPADCDWGEVRVPYQGSPIIVPYKFSFATDTLTAQLTNGRRLEVQVSTHFTDSSGRPDYKQTYLFD